MKSGAYIFLASGFDPAKDKTILHSSIFKMQVIGLDPEYINEVCSLALTLVDGGVEFIELCGGFGPLWITKIKEITNHKIPVGSVFYGPEDRRLLLGLTSETQKLR